MSRKVEYSFELRPCQEGLKTILSDYLIEDNIPHMKWRWEGQESWHHDGMVKPEEVLNRIGNENYQKFLKGQEQFLVEFKKG